MAVRTSNKYGKIIVSDKAVAMCAWRAASECYGVVKVASNGPIDSLSSFLHKNTRVSGVKVTTIDNRIFLDLSVILKKGVSVEAVTESVRSVVTYSVESFTGMRVKQVIVNALGGKE